MSELHVDGTAIGNALAEGLKAGLGLWPYGDGNIPNQRERIATAAMMGDLAAQSEETGEYSAAGFPTLAQRSVAIADALIDALNAPKAVPAQIQDPKVALLMELREALFDLIREEPTNRENLLCHFGICTPEDCQRCKRVAAARAAIEKASR